MRIVTLVLGLVLCVLWMVGIDTGATEWLAWFDFLAALVAVVSGVIPAGPTRMLRGEDFVLGGTLLLAAAYGLYAGATGWLSSGTAATGVGFVILGALPQVHQAAARLSRPDRHSHA